MVVLKSCRSRVSLWYAEQVAYADTNRLTIGLPDHDPRSAFSSGPLVRRRHKASRRSRSLRYLHRAQCRLFTCPPRNDADITPFIGMARTSRQATITTSPIRKPVLKSKSTPFIREVLECPSPSPSSSPLLTRTSLFSHPILIPARRAFSI